MKCQKSTYILVLILILIILYGITIFYLDKKIVREHFKGQHLRNTLIYFLQIQQIYLK